eukprot:gene35536-16501_t
MPPGGMQVWLSCPERTHDAEFDPDATVGDATLQVGIGYGDSGGASSARSLPPPCCLLVAADIWGEKHNVRLQFAERPQPRALLTAIEQQYLEDGRQLYAFQPMVYLHS